MSQPTHASQQAALRGPGVLVVTGGTDGIGRALAERRLREGDTVVVIGRAREKGEAFLAHAHGLGAAGRAHFIRADLGLLADNQRVIDELRGAFPVIDTLVFCARYYRSDRAETAEGIEETFAHFYLSRYQLGHGLAGPLGRSAHPVIVNVAGPGAGLDVIRWDDLEFRDGYHGGAALGQAGKLNDLLGVTSAERYAAAGLRYVLVHPGATVTSIAGQYDEATRRHIEEMQRTAKPVAEALEPIAAVIGRPPRQPLSAFVEGHELDVLTGDFDPAAARRLDALTESFLKDASA
ncbi:SDR family NAD(P)-dependent oxidoreductase [Streptomyces kunmingensis]|uniref:SDR family NAD(P)-dependent oxidoreductase n=1 Tax=Streptomyces kunmingensis TaxID=68225 RepID=A0ABU6CJG0_9ACTN|nr:SDR family NAD(P)-dependent oxidoreductase [Streptomyces kunmingensis]MEB3964823.1 SDR family NAD(P)-dependent oxidoreductase [Streptomyces kunmingensis]